MRIVADLTGRRYGKLLVIRKTEKRNNDGSVLWECLCDCGKKCFVTSTRLVKRKTNSCGCLRIIRSKERPDNYTKERFKMQDNTNLAMIKKQNAKSNSLSGVRGVSYRKDRGYFRASLMFQGKLYQEGGFATIEEAQKARERLYDRYVLPYIEKAEAENG